MQAGPWPGVVWTVTGDVMSILCLPSFSPEIYLNNLCCTLTLGRQSQRWGTAGYYSVAGPEIQLQRLAGRQALVRELTPTVLQGATEGSGALA